MLLLSTLLAAPFAAPLPQTSYDFIQLTGPGGAGLNRVFDINDAGVVAGSALVQGEERAALWSAETGVQILSGLTGPSVATSVNDAGQVAGSTLLGSSDTANRAFLWDAGVITSYEPVAPTEATAGADITEDGRILVSSGFFGGGSDTTLIPRAFFGDASGAGPVIPSIFPRAVSATGDIAGTDTLFLNGQAVNLQGFMTGDRASSNAVNDAGVAVGRIVRLAGGFNSNSFPVIWDESQVVSMLPVPNTFLNSTALDINNAGQIVGRADNQAFFFEVGGSPVFLESVAQGVPSGIRLREANEINERGQILGTQDNGSFFSEERFLLVPSLQVGNSFCMPGLNSEMRTATLFAEGSVSVSSNSLTLRATDARDGFGLFVASATQAAPSPLGDGFLCLGGQLRRLPPAVAIQDGIGSIDLDLPFLGVMAGDSQSFQFWYRDVTPGGAGFNLTQAIEVTFEQ